MNTREYLESQIRHLWKELSVDIPEDLQDAISQGDLRENSEYTSALSRQYYATTRLEQLMHRLAQYNQYQQTQPDISVVHVGCKVRLRDLATKRLFYAKIVVADIDDYEDSCEEITMASPVGTALLGKRIQDTVQVITPAGAKQYKILQILPNCD